MPERPHNDPQTDSVTGLGKTEPDAVLCQSEPLLPPSPTRREAARGELREQWEFFVGNAVRAMPVLYLNRHAGGGGPWRGRGDAARRAEPPA